ncbi:hypothetical protein [Xylanivirga thermophila]|uniref:hypothetical protein n=1 Tax=Xylanivirga thermophila TaxID=2496273 RepID=UPI00101BD1BE|nr:hypothetical protein [Xylanivirga thermophila]
MKKAVLGIVVVLLLIYPINVYAETKFEQGIITSPIFDVVKDGFFTSVSDGSISLENVNELISDEITFIEKPNVIFTPNGSEETDTFSVTVSYEGDISEEVVESIYGVWSDTENPSKISDWGLLGRKPQTVEYIPKKSGEYYYHVKMDLIAGETLYFKSNSFHKTNIPPKITINNPDGTQIINEDDKIIISGIVTDTDSQSVMISAEIDGVLKSIILQTPTTDKSWSLSWAGNELGHGIHSGILDTDQIFKTVKVVADDGRAIREEKYTGILMVDKIKPKMKIVIDK